MNIAAGLMLLFMMLVAMNGFSEGDAAWGLGAYIVLAIIVSIVMSIGAAMFVQFLLKKHFSGVVSALIAIPLFSIVAIGLEVVCSLIGVGVSEFVRVNY